MAAISAIDWASEHHDVHVADEMGAVLERRRFAHTEEGVSALIGLLVDHRVGLVAIERPDGLLVGRLLAAGLRVMAVHPNQLAAARGRFRAAAGKSDRFDAMVLCEPARTDAHRLRVLVPLGDETQALRSLVRAREDLVGAKVAPANQLRAQLDASWPGGARIFASIDSPIALAFLARYPSAADARSLGPRRLASFLARHSYCGRRSPGRLLERLRSAPVAALGEAEAEARRTAVAGLVAALAQIVAEVRRLEAEIGAAVRAHPDGEIFRKSVLTAAGLLAEIGDDRGRYRDADSLAADGGVAPVAVESGKSRHASFRWACDKRLRAHLGVLADSTRHWHSWAGDVYARARARGHDHREGSEARGVDTGRLTTAPGGWWWC